jgi:uncharacterized protein
MNTTPEKQAQEHTYRFAFGEHRYAFDAEQRIFRKETDAEAQQTPGDAALHSDLADRYYGSDSIKENVGISIHLVHGCNMGCYYCSVDAGMNFHGATRRLSKETAKDIVDFIFREYADAPGYQINFSVGGEPLLNVEALKFVMEYSGEKAREAGKPVEYSIATNGLLLTEELLGFLNENNMHKYLSIDGPPEVQNAMRVTTEGGPTYDRVREKIELIHSTEEKAKPARRFSGIATLTPLHPSVIDAVEHLLSCGFARVAINPVRSGPDKAVAINAKNIEAVKQAYTEFAEVLLKQARENDSRYLDAIMNHSDFMGRFMLRLLARNNASFRCTAGKWGYSITADGGIYPCDEFVGMDDYKAGDVYSGIDESKRTDFLRADVETLKICSACWAKHICGGICPKDSILLHGAIERPNQIECSLIKHVIKQGIHVLATIREEQPGFYYGHILAKANQGLQGRFLRGRYHAALERLRQHKDHSRFGFVRKISGKGLSGLLALYGNATARRILLRAARSGVSYRIARPFGSPPPNKTAAPDRMEYIFGEPPGMKAPDAR